MRVLLGAHTMALNTQTAADETEMKSKQSTIDSLGERLWNLAQLIWDEQPWERLQEQYAKRLAPIATNWTALETALEAPESGGAGRPPRGR